MQNSNKIEHYYGDIVRLIFIAIAVIVLIGLPKISSMLGIPIGLSIIAVVILGLSAGFTSPRYIKSLLLNTIVSLLGLIASLYISVFMFQNGLKGVFLFLNQIISILFLISLYFSIKSVRGFPPKIQ